MLGAQTAGRVDGAARTAPRPGRRQPIRRRSVPDALRDAANLLLAPDAVDKQTGRARRPRPAPALAAPTALGDGGRPAPQRLCRRGRPPNPLMSSSVQDATSDGGGVLPVRGAASGTPPGAAAAPWRHSRDGHRARRRGWE